MCVKIDVEGAKYEVLKGAIKTFENLRPYLIMETFPHNKKQVFKFLRRYKYKVMHIEHNNYLFIPLCN